MSDVVARPMPVPDLAGLLTRPKRPTKEPTSEEDQQPQAAAPQDASATPEPAVDHVSSLIEGNAAVTEDDSADSAPQALRRTTHIPPVPPRPTPRDSQTSLEDAGGRRQYLRTKAVQLPRSVHRRVTEEAARRGTTGTALMLTAINSTYRLLPAALRERQRPAGSLFDIPQDRLAQEPTVQTTLRMTDTQLEAINELVTANSTNRSRLFGVAISLFLDGAVEVTDSA